MRYETVSGAHGTSEEVVLTLFYPQEHEAIVRTLAKEHLLSSNQGDRGGVIREASDREGGVLSLRYPQGYKPLVFEYIQQWLRAAEVCGLIAHYTDPYREGKGTAL